MSDPRQDPNWRGMKCKACGERLPFLFDDTCTYCTIEAKDRRIAELTKANAKLNHKVGEYVDITARLRSTVNDRDSEINILRDAHRRLRAVLLDIASQSKSNEMDAGLRAEADFEGAYDIMIQLARAATREDG